MSRFTADEAFEAADCGEPIEFEPAAAVRCVQSHGVTWGEWESDCEDKTRLYHADAILAWLGY